MNPLDHDGWAMGLPIIDRGDNLENEPMVKPLATVWTGVAVGVIFALGLGAHWL